MSKSSIEDQSSAEDFQSFEVDVDYAGERLDKVLSAYFPDISRSRLQSWIKNDQVTVNDEVVNKPKHKIVGSELISVEMTLVDQDDWVATEMDLPIHYQDDQLIVINKPVGLVVHPAPGHYDDTLVNGLLFHFPQLRKLQRAGIVHRLDRDTSGLLVVAKTIQAHAHLVEQLQNRAFEREYVAVVHGQLVAGDTIDLPIGRHPVNRKKMAVVSNGREAITHYRIAQKFDDFTCVNVKLETGRTHQIRVHFSHLKHPLVGDQVYGLHNLKPKGASENLSNLLANFNRQALHAKALGLIHPETKERMKWESDLPEDITQLIEAIELNEQQD
ncbi:MAG: 23S rRNA pseudouridine(1911/1915/1917) synthase RluD [Gammaproteobacteria bacterium]|nr:23S rRNA pseudouridine(1911/1915/1917) synthase RluD [Gammaproteobacteria bacterium]